MTNDDSFFHNAVAACSCDFPDLNIEQIKALVDGSVNLQSSSTVSRRLLEGLSYCTATSRRQVILDLDSDSAEVVVQADETAETGFFIGHSGGKGERASLFAELLVICGLQPLRRLLLETDLSVLSTLLADFTLRFEDEDSDYLSQHHDNAAESVGEEDIFGEDDGDDFVYESLEVGPSDVDATRYDHVDAPTSRILTMPSRQEVEGRIVYVANLVITSELSWLQSLSNADMVRLGVAQLVRDCVLATLQHPSYNADHNLAARLLLLFGGATITHVSLVEAAGTLYADVLSQTSKALTVKTCEGPLLPMAQVLESLQQVAISAHKNATTLSEWSTIIQRHAEALIAQPLTAILSHVKNYVAQLRDSQTVSVEGSMGTCIRALPDIISAHLQCPAVLPVVDTLMATGIWRDMLVLTTKLYPDFESADRWLHLVLRGACLHKSLCQFALAVRDFKGIIDSPDFAKQQPGQLLVWNLLAEKPGCLERAVSYIEEAAPRSGANDVEVWSRLASVLSALTLWNRVMTLPLLITALTTLREKVVVAIEYETRTFADQIANEAAGLAPKVEEDNTAKKGRVVRLEDLSLIWRNATLSFLKKLLGVADKQE